MADASGRTVAQPNQPPATEKSSSDSFEQQQPVIEVSSSDGTTKVTQDERRQLSDDERPSNSASTRDLDDTRARTTSPAQSRQGSRPPDTSHAVNIPKRPDLERGASHPSRLPLPPSLPNKPEAPRGYRHEGRSSRQSDVKDDRREARETRHPDSGRSNRYPDADRDRAHESDTRSNSRLDRDRVDAQRNGPSADDQFRSSRDSRHHRETEADRQGNLRSSDPSSRPAPQPHPDRADLIREHPDRVALIEGDNQRRDSSRLERDDRKHRPSSPSRGDERRGPRHDEYPAGPRSERTGRPDLLEIRDSRPVADGPQGRGTQDSRMARQSEVSSDTPSGPRNRAGQPRGRNVSMPQPPPGTPAAPSDRQPPTGPSGRSSGRILDTSSSAPSPSGDKVDTTGVHPDRLKNLQVQTDGSPANSRAQAPLAPPTGPRGSHGHSNSSPLTRGPPSGPVGDRGRGDKRFAGINDMLQQSGGSQDRSGQGTMIRGRGRQSSSANNAPLPEGGPVNPQADGPDEAAVQPKTELFPGGREEDNRSSGRGRRNDAAQEGNRGPRRSNKHENHVENPERERREEDETTRGGRRDERRDRGRDREREHDRSRRNDKAEDQPHQPMRESTGRRATGGRDDHRKRDRRDREDGPGDMPGPGTNDHHGRNRPSSSHSSNNNSLPPPPPPQGPAGSQGEDRRWGGGGRGENRDRDRNRDRGSSGRDRERDYNRDNGPAGGNQTLPRKRGRPGDEAHGHGDGGPRGMRVGSESKRVRRGT